MLQRIARRVVMAVVMAVTGMIALATQDSDVARYDKVNSGAYAVVAEIRAKPGKERALRDATLSLVAAVRAEPNNLLYFLHEDRESPGLSSFMRSSPARRASKCTTPRRTFRPGSPSCLNWLMVQ